MHTPTPMQHPPPSHTPTHPHPHTLTCPPRHTHLYPDTYTPTSTPHPCAEVPHAARVVLVDRHNAIKHLRIQRNNQRGAVVCREWVLFRGWHPCNETAAPYNDAVGCGRVKDAADRRGCDGVEAGDNLQAALRLDAGESGGKGAGEGREHEREEVEGGWHRI
jgi:hypothetical protein